MPRGAGRRPAPGSEPHGREPAAHYVTVRLVRETDFEGTLEDLAPVPLDYVEIDQALSNLRENAATYPPTEYDLVKAFIAHPSKVLTDRVLLQRVWGPEYGDENHYVHVYVARLRKKIEPDPQNPKYLITEPGVGYRLLAEEA
ncbi:MAG: winged helix-turn-helix domain-containing protein [Chloroflexi bacterium]|nr:winged helix-turn-helix domain-containing protein [Chloroflexota bacterium]